MLIKPALHVEIGSTVKKRKDPNIIYKESYDTEDWNVCEVRRIKR